MRLASYELAANDHFKEALIFFEHLRGYHNPIPVLELASRTFEKDFLALSRLTKEIAEDYDVPMDVCTDENATLSLRILPPKDELRAAFVKRVETFASAYERNTMPALYEEKSKKGNHTHVSSNIVAMFTSQLAVGLGLAATHLRA